MRYNTPQHILNAEKRYENVKGNFGLKDKSLLEGKSILLVDDVITTCSTVKACCLALKESKDIKIYACSLATSRVRL
ncbi:MAG: hypothetical protein IJ748_06785 [Bacteroidales bacterium]|nr:hypothetical protein [Bacteroidales bacterium]